MPLILQVYPANGVVLLLAAANRERHDHVDKALFAGRATTRGTWPATNGKRTLDHTGFDRAIVLDYNVHIDALTHRYAPPEVC